MQICTFILHGYYGNFLLCIKNMIYTIMQNFASFLACVRPCKYLLDNFLIILVFWQPKNLFVVLSKLLLKLKIENGTISVDAFLAIVCDIWNNLMFFLMANNKHHSQEVIFHFSLELNNINNIEIREKPQDR